MKAISLYAIASFVALLGVVAYNRGYENGWRKAVQYHINSAEPYQWVNGHDGWKLPDNYQGPCWIYIKRPVSETP